MRMKNLEVAFRQAGHRVLSAALSAALLFGCSTVSVSQLSTGEVASIQSGEAAIVLFRMTATVDGEPQATHIGDFTQNAVILSAIPVAELGPYSATPNRALSETALVAGWRYTLLAPGAYRMGTGWYPPVNGTWRSNGGEGVPPSFGLVVPQGLPLVYAGSIRFECSKNWPGSGGAGCAGRVPVRDETTEAETVARTAFAEHGAPVRMLMTAPYGAPIALERLRALGSVRVVSAGEERLVTPDWWQRSANRYLGWYGEPSPYPSSGGGRVDPLFGILMLMLYGAYVPFGSAVASREAETEEAKWQPCMVELAEELAAFDADTVLGEGLVRRLESVGIAPDPKAPDGPNTDPDQIGALLKAEIQGIVLQECEERGTYCLEISVRRQLLDGLSGRILDDAVLVYTNPTRRRGKSRLYETIVEPYSECEKLETLCGVDGKATLRERLRRGLNALAGRIVPATNVEN